VDLTPVMQKFILHWGEMGTRWGINRTVAQIHALLYLSPRPLNAEEIATTLGVARSNVSTSLKELQNWGIVRVTHVMGDRRDHFESMKDVWEMFRVILDERKKRETDPTLHLLRDLLGFFETMSTWYSQVRCLPQQAMLRFVRMGGQVRKWLGKAS
jgi:DNA-binding transcriptional regulator GbsR (MarR family)